MPTVLMPPWRIGNFPFNMIMDLEDSFLCQPLKSHRQIGLKYVHLRHWAFYMDDTINGIESFWFFKTKKVSSPSRIDWNSFYFSFFRIIAVSSSLYYLEKAKAITRKYYSQLLTKVCRNILKKKRNGRQKHFVLYDNALVHELHMQWTKFAIWGSLW